MIEVDLQVPAAPATRSYGPVSRTDFVRYQGASGDMNPIHHDEEFAKAAGFPTPFSVGMWQAGLVGTYAVDWLGRENVRDFRIRFQQQVWPGDTLSCNGSVVRTYILPAGTVWGETELASDEARVDVELSCRRQTGDLALTVWATFVLPGVEPTTSDSSKDQ